MSGYQFIGKATPSVQKQINTSLVYHYIFEHSPCHRAGIAKDLNLSAPAVSRAVEILLERKDILETKKTQLENGKWVVQLLYNAKKGYVVGIDLLRDPLKMVVADFGGNIVKRRTGFSMDRADDITGDLVAETGRLIESFLAETKDRTGRDVSVKAVGIGVPATIDSVSGTVLGTQRYDHMLGKNYGRSMAEAFGIPIFVDNITNLSAIAERRRGVSKGMKNSVFFEISAGIGLGLFINGALFAGSYGAAGEIGYTPVCLEHLNDRHGTLGYLERTIAMQGIADRAVAMGIIGKPDDAVAGTAEVFSLAHGGDRKAQAICDDLLQNLVVLCSNIILILNPEQVVIGGSIAGMPYVRELILDRLRTWLGTIIPFDLPEIALSSLGDDSGVIGAVQVGIERLTAEQYPYRFDG